MKSKVYLVGAGPGDPELLTLKALRLLKTADAVLYDGLVSPAILGLVSPSARLHNVGKRCGAKKITQAEINFLMVSYATSGLTVVRLKSGDPLIFGRSGEEMEALDQAGIACELVPGVTAALGAAAAAQIPLTHRQISHALVLLPGQVAKENQFADWRKLASSGATLAIYMPGHNYQVLAEQLLEAGLARATPCAIISSATNEEQAIAQCSLGELSSLDPLRSPALLLVGEVVGFARSASEQPIPWIESNPLRPWTKPLSFPEKTASAGERGEIL
jgi:uroporphyrin-III C-methyltransferase